MPFDASKVERFPCAGSADFTLGIHHARHVRACNFDACAAALDEARSEVEKLEAKLGQCYLLSGADPDIDADDLGRLAPHAVSEVKRLREESDKTDAENLRLGAEVEKLKGIVREYRDSAIGHWPCGHGGVQCFLCKRVDEALGGK